MNAHLQMVYTTLVVIWWPVGRYCITCWLTLHCVPFQIWQTKARDAGHTQKKKRVEGRDQYSRIQFTVLSRMSYADTLGESKENDIR